MTPVERLARISSIIFHPLWMPLLIYVIVRVLDPFYITGTPMDYFILLLLFINTAAPAASILIMMRFGMVSDMQLYQRSERVAPYLLVIFYYGVSWWVLWWKDPGFPDFVFRFFGGVILSLVSALIINIRWKISMHMIAQGGVLGSLLAIHPLMSDRMNLAILLAILAGGLVGASRLLLGAHSHSQVYAGYVLGIVINWGLSVLP